jgi:hypothetical protein
MKSIPQHLQARFLQNPKGMDFAAKIKEKLTLTKTITKDDHVLLDPQITRNCALGKNQLSKKALKKLIMRAVGEAKEYRQTLDEYSAITLIKEHIGLDIDDLLFLRNAYICLCAILSLHPRTQTRTFNYIANVEFVNLIFGNYNFGHIDRGGIIGALEKRLDYLAYSFMLARKRSDLVAVVIDYDDPAECRGMAVHTNEYEMYFQDFQRCLIDFSAKIKYAAFNIESAIARKSSDKNSPFFIKIHAHGLVRLRDLQRYENLRHSYCWNYTNIISAARKAGFEIKNTGESRLQFKANIISGLEDMILDSPKYKKCKERGANGKAIDPADKKFARTCERLLFRIKKMNDIYDRIPNPRLKIKRIIKSKTPQSYLERIMGLALYTSKFSVLFEKRHNRNKRRIKYAMGILESKSPFLYVHHSMPTVYLKGLKYQGAAGIKNKDLRFYGDSKDRYLTKIRNAARLIKNSLKPNDPAAMRRLRANIGVELKDLELERFDKTVNAFKKKAAADDKEADLKKQLEIRKNGQNNKKTGFQAYIPALKNDLCRMALDQLGIIKLCTLSYVDKRPDEGYRSGIPIGTLRYLTKPRIRKKPPKPNS